MNILIHNWASWCAYKASPVFSTENTVLSTSPTVLKGLASTVPVVVDISATLDVDDLNRAGDAIINLALDWRDKIDAACSAELDGIRAGLLLGEHLPLLISALTFHFAASRPYIEGAEKLHIPVRKSDESPLHGKPTSKLYDREWNTFAILAEHSQGANHITITETALDEIEVPPVVEPDLSQDRASHSFTNKMIDRVLARSSVPNFFIGHQIFKQSMSRGVLRGISQFHSKDRCLILGNRPNPSLNRLLPKFLLDGWRLEAMANIPKDRIRDSVPVPELRDELSSTLNALPDRVAWARPALSVAMERVMVYLESVLLPYARKAIPLVRKHATKTKGADATVFASNGLFDPASCLIAAIYKSENIPVVMYQHGTLGITKIFESNTKFREILQSDLFVLFSGYERSFIAEHVPDCSTTFVTFGSDSIQKPPAPYLARWLTRSRWNCPTGRRCIVFAPSTCEEEDIWLPYHFVRGNYFTQLSNLIENVFAGVNGHVVVKVKKKGVSVRDAPDRNRHKIDPIQLLALPDNVHIEHWPDLRICRNAADIIIVDRGHSTPGIALHAERPLVYINHAFDPLTPNISEIMGNSVFVINSNEDDWEDQLLTILNMSDNALAAAWKAKAPARKILKDQFILGVQKSGDYLQRILANTASTGADNPVPCDRLLREDMTG